MQPVPELHLPQILNLLSHKGDEGLNSLPSCDLWCQDVAFPVGGADTLERGSTWVILQVPPREGPRQQEALDGALVAGVKEEERL